MRQLSMIRLIKFIRRSTFIQKMFPINLTIFPRTRRRWSLQMTFSSSAFIQSSVKTDLMEIGANSTLLVAKVNKTDSGNYTCSIGESQQYTVLVHVLNGKSIMLYDTIFSVRISRFRFTDTFSGSSCKAYKDCCRP